MSSSAKPKKSRFGPPKAELQNLAAKLMSNTTPLPSNFVPPPQNQYPLEDGSQPRHVVPPMPSMGETASSKLFVSSLPPEASSDDLRQAFEPFGAVLSADVVKSRENPEYNRGFGFIQFYTQADADKALSSAVHMNGQTLFVKISDKPSSSGGRPADWDCMQCGAKGCFGSKPNCFKCGAPNPANPNAAPSNGPGGFERRANDWDCPACGAKGCFGSKATCFKCGGQRPLQNSGGFHSGGRGNFGGRNDSYQGGRNDNYGGRNDYNSGGYDQGQNRGGYQQQDRGGYSGGYGQQDRNRGGYEDRGGRDRRDRRGGYDDRGGDRRRDRDYDRRY